MKKTTPDNSEIVLKNKIETWLKKPLNAKFMPLIAIILIGIAYMIILSMQKIDGDSLYMIAQGREILESGFPKYNNFVFFENYEIVIQQWIYCVILAIINDSIGNIGLIIFATLQGILLFTLIEKKLKFAIQDKFWTYMLAGILCLTASGYYFSLRPENITYILLTADCLILEKYKQTNKSRYLYLLPLMTLIEINIHASMWVFHFCILLAHIVPSIINSAIENNNIKINKHLIINIILMIASLFINPYGIRNITYTFNSLETFGYILMREQTNITFLSMSGIILVVNIMLLTLGIKNKKIKSTTLYINLGFTTLATTSYHSAMFLLFALIFNAYDYLTDLKTKIKDAKASDTMKNDIWIIIIAVALCLSLAVSMLFSGGNSIYEFKNRSNLNKIAEYIKEDDPDNSEHILTNVDCGSYLEYYELKNLFGDTRPEMLNKKINKVENTMELVPLFMYNTKPTTLEIKSIEEALKYYDIKYIVDYEDTPLYYALWTYIETTGSYEKIEIDNTNTNANIKKFMIYKRIENTETNSNTERTE